jgi:hypothetical protein
MIDRFAFGRLAGALPATTVALAGSVLLTFAIASRFVVGNAGPDAGSVIGPVLLIFGLFIVIGLLMDGSANSRATTHWEEILPVSATALERHASGYFADHGWTAQRDDADFKVFVRRTRLNVALLLVLAFLGVFRAVLYLAFWSLSRPEVMTVKIAPVLDGARIEMIGPNAAMNGFYQATVSELSPPTAGRIGSGDRPMRADGNAVP